jgi:hypothetical protein
MSLNNKIEINSDLTPKMSERINNENPIVNFNFGYDYTNNNSNSDIFIDTTFE